MTDARLTPTQRKIMDVLSDGRSHAVADLRALLPDDLAGESALRKHICLMRQVVQVQGLDILHHREYRRAYYRLVRNISSAAE